MGREPGIGPAQLTCPNTDTDHSDQSVPVLFAPLFLEGHLAAFEATRRACALAGWEYRLVGALDPVATANLRWLAGYRHPRYGIPALAGALRAAFAAPAPLVDGAEAAGDPIAVLPVLYHLLWRQELAADLSVGSGVGPGRASIASAGKPPLAGARGISCGCCPDLVPGRGAPPLPVIGPVHPGRWTVLAAARAGLRLIENNLGSG